ncbi:MAG: hypothetical protein M3068_00015, partial [Gemmatimonadota bacterium]|nr:hypothetical protein [Gemmatimonadota bacterium]
PRIRGEALRFCTRSRAGDDGAGAHSSRLSAPPSRPFLPELPLSRLPPFLFAILLCLGCDPSQQLVGTSPQRRDAAHQIDSALLVQLRAVEVRRAWLLAAHSGDGIAPPRNGQGTPSGSSTLSCDALDDEIDALDRRYDETLSHVRASSAGAALVAELERLTSAVERLDSAYHRQRCAG